jgi:hypothetical protein
VNLGIGHHSLIRQEFFTQMLDGNDVGDIQPICDYALDNSKWRSGKVILDSVSLELCWETVEKALGADAVGPEPFAAIIYKLQQVSFLAAVRSLVDDLKKLPAVTHYGTWTGCQHICWWQSH